MGALIGYLLVAYAAYWIIRNAVYGAMKDFERWKRKRYGEPDRDAAAGPQHVIADAVVSRR